MEKANIKWIKNEKISVEPRVNFTFGDWPSGYTVFLAKQSNYREMKVTKDLVS